MRIYLATPFEGMRDNDVETMMRVGKPRYLLNTFFEGENPCKRALSIVGTENFLLDSGAFSFMSGAQCTEKIVEEYAERYIDFIKRNHVKLYFEMDVETVLSLPFVEKMRSKMERETGVPCIPVWHKNRGVEYFKRMCSDYRYIAIGGLVFHVKRSEWPLIHKMVDYAANKGVKVHGLGFTKTRELENWRFYSVDSSSWKIAAIRGSNRHIFNGRYIETHNVKKDGYKTDQRLLAAYNGIEWCKYQRYMDTRRTI